MDFKQNLWDELDVIFADDTPIPEGKEQISEEDFDMILEGADEDDE